jgi:predicted metal-dependent phosphoesterase TrpH
VVRLAKKAGIDGLAITDHKVTTGWKEANEEARKLDMIFIPGMEIQAQEGHIIGLGLNEPVKNQLTVDETLEHIRDQGGLSVAPHPYDIKNDGVKDHCLKADAIEVYNSFGMDRLANWFTQRKARKSGRPMVVGSDVHMPEMMGLAVNFADAHSMEELFSEIRRGRVGFRTSMVPSGAVVQWARGRINNSYSDVMNYIEGNYPQPKKWISNKMVNNFVKSQGRFWNLMGRFAVGCSVVYGGVKLLTY